MNIILDLSSNELDHEDLQILTQQLCRSIANETDITAEIPSGKVVQGKKGDSVNYHKIALTLFGSGGVAITLYEIFKTVFNRNSSITIKTTKADGSPLEITAENITVEQMQTLFSQVNNTESSDE